MLWDISGHLKAEQSTREQELASIDGRILRMEHGLTEGVGKHDQQINDLMVSHSHLRDICGSFEDRRYASDTQQVVLDERLKGMETLLSDALADHFQELNQTKRQLQVLHGRLDVKQNSGETSRGAMREPQTAFESRLGKLASKRGFRDLDQILENGGPPLDHTRAPASLRGDQASLSTTDSDYFRHVSRLIIKDDTVDTDFRAAHRHFSHSPKSNGPRPTISRVTSLPALIPSMLGSLA